VVWPDLDAQQITQRICGVCPVSHGTAAVLAQDEAYQIMPPGNGQFLRNLMLATNYLQRGNATMSYATIQVEPLTPRIGASVYGVKLSEPLAEQTVQELNQALLDHLVLFFRDQDLTFDQHKRFGRYFGELHIHPSAPAAEGHPEILRIHADARTKRTAGDKWHSDVSCEETPPMGSILRLHTLPESGGDTLFASMYAAYDALSEPMQDYLGKLTASHDGAPNYSHRNQLAGVDNTGKVFPRAEHPVVRTHPVTGKKALFVNPAFTTHITGVPPEESEAILHFLYAHIAKPQFHCRFKWEQNSVAFWDNRCAQHHAMWDYYPHVRSGYRVTICGDRPF
jgi:taurine dioxygenase